MFINYIGWTPPVSSLFLSLNLKQTVQSEYSWEDQATYSATVKKLEIM
jgi:hypothetical protein